MIHFYPHSSLSDLVVIDESGSKLDLWFLEFGERAEAREGDNLTKFEFIGENFCP